MVVRPRKLVWVPTKEVILLRLKAPPNPQLASSGNGHNLGGVARLGSMCRALGFGPGPRVTVRSLRAFERSQIGPLGRTRRLLERL
jgi:hypothetical protein